MRWRHSEGPYLEPPLCPQVCISLCSVIKYLEPPLCPQITLLLQYLEPQPPPSQLNSTHIAMQFNSPLYNARELILDTLFYATHHAPLFILKFAQPAIP